MKSIIRFFKDDSGLETVEYAVMTALIVAVLVTTLALLGEAINTRFGELRGVVESAGQGSGGA